MDYSELYNFVELRAHLGEDSLSYGSFNFPYIYNTYNSLNILHQFIAQILTPSFNPSLLVIGVLSNFNVWGIKLYLRC